MGSVTDDDPVEQEHEPQRSICPICGEPEVGRRRPDAAEATGAAGFNDADEPALVSYCENGHEWWPQGTAHRS
jgi:hypothetical protein